MEVGKAATVLSGHTGSVRSVAYSADGKALATGSRDGTVKNWNIHDPTTSSTIPTEYNANVVWCVAYSPTSSRIAIGSRDALRIWNVDSQQSTTLQEGIEIHSVAYASDGLFLVAGSADHKARVWNVLTGNCDEFVGHTDEIYCVAYAPNRLSIATGSRDHSAILWNVQNRQPIVTFEGHSGWIWSVQYSPNGAFLATGSQDHSARLWQVHDAACTCILRGHTDEVKSVAWSPLPTNIPQGPDTEGWSLDGSLVVTASIDKTVRVWDVTSGSCTVILEEHAMIVNSVAWTPDGMAIATGCADHKARIWNIATGQRLVPSLSHDNDDEILSPNRRTKASLGNNLKTVYIEPVVTSGSPHTIRLDHNIRVRKIQWSPDSMMIATASEDDKVSIWNVATGGRVTILTGHTNAVHAIAWSSDSKRLATGSKDQRGKLWDLTTGHNVIQCIRTLVGHSGKVVSIAWSPDDATIATGSKDLTVRLWNSMDGQCIGTLNGHDGKVSCIAWSPDSATIATGSKDKTVRLWNFASRKCIKSVGTLLSASSIMWNDPSILEIHKKDSTKMVLDLSTFVARDGTRLDPEFSSFPLSPLTLNDHILYDLESAKNASNYHWPFFQKIKPKVIKFTLHSDWGTIKRDTLSAEERNTLFEGSSATWENPLHCAVRCGDKAASLLRMMLDMAPSEAVQSRWVNEDGGHHQIPKKMSLLARALEVDSTKTSSANIETILSFYSKLLAPTNDDKGHNEEASSLSVFKGNDCPDLYVAHRRHCADLICVEEICRVAGKYPRIFLHFVETLRAVPNYEFIHGPDLSLAPMGNLRFVLAGSEERVPGAATTPFWTRIKFDKSRLLMPNPFPEDEDIRIIERMIVFFRSIFLAVGDGYGRINPVVTIAISAVHSYIRSTFGHGEEFSVSPGLIPLKNLAGLDGDKIGPFLQKVVDAAERLNAYSVFENEVVQYVVEYKWRIYACQKFSGDIMNFAILITTFISNALLFERYAHANGSAKLLGISLCALSIRTCQIFVFEELGQFWKACRGGIERVGAYFGDGWSIFDAVCLSLLVATYASQLYDLTLPESTINNKGWNRRTNSLAATCMPFLAFKTLFYLKALHVSGPLVRMTINIISNIKVFCGILFLFIVTFASSFVLLFQPVEKPSSSCEFVFDGAYADFHKTLLAVFTMLLGDINLSDIMQLSSPGLAALLVVMFLFITGVVLLNMLIAIMSDLYDEVNENAIAQATYARARLILEIESRFTTECMRRNKKKWFPKWIQVLKNGTFENKRGEEDETAWEGRIKAVTKPMLKSIEQVRNDLLEAMEERFENKIELAQQEILTLVRSIEAKVCNG